MRLRVTRLDDGKTETSSVPLGLQREYQDLDDDMSALDRMAYAAWRIWHQAGWTSTESWQDFSWEISCDVAAEDEPDPKAQP